MSILSNGIQLFHRFGVSVRLQVALAALVLSASVLWIWSPVWNWERHVLPGFIAVDGVLASSSTGGFGEGCWSAVYTLSEATVSQLRRSGISYLQQAPIVQGGKSTRFREWVETPGRIDLKTDGRDGSKQTIFGLYAMDGCDASGSSDYRTGDIAKALSESGSYYAVTDNREGIVLLFPMLRLAAYYYFG